MDAEAGCEEGGERGGGRCLFRSSGTDILKAEEEERGERCAQDSIRADARREEKVNGCEYGRRAAEGGLAASLR